MINQYSTPAGASLQLVPNSKFKIHNLPIPLALAGVGWETFLCYLYLL